MIHEGTHGIQAADLLGRKVRMEGGKGMQLLAARMQATAQRASFVPHLQAHAKALLQALSDVGKATQAAWATGDPIEALANAVPYMQAFGHTVIAWIWLDVAESIKPSNDAKTIAMNDGRIAGTRFFFQYELPKIGAWLSVVESRDMTCAHLSEEAF